MKTQFGTLHPDGSVTNAMSVDLDAAGSSDPLAYAYGLFHGKSGEPLPNPDSEEYKELAPEYLRGHADGSKE
jgi:hypothetical protein